MDLAIGQAPDLSACVEHLSVFDMTLTMCVCVYTLIHFDRLQSASLYVS